MKAFRCDRCLKLFEDVPAVVLREKHSEYYQSSGEGGMREIELCDGCRSLWIAFRQRTRAEDLVARV